MRYIGGYCVHVSRAEASGNTVKEKDELSRNHVGNLFMRV
jgi:hypothetical protein